jgi:primosomal protein N' (replication factor Y)
LFLLRGKFRFRLLVKAQREINLPDFIRQWVQAQSPPASVRIKMDIDPQSFL